MPAIKLLNLKAPGATQDVLRRPFRARAGILGLACLVTSGCADLDPAYNPIEWGRSAGRAVSAAITGEDPPPAPPRVEPPPAHGRPFPNLATVPRPPARVQVEDQDEAVGRLMEHRDAARAADRSLRTAEIAPLPSSIAPRRVTRPSVLADPQRPAPEAAPREEAASAAGSAPPERQQAAAPVRLGSSAFLGSVLMRGEGDGLAEFERRVLDDAAAMAARSGGRVRLVGPEAERTKVAQALVRRGVAAGRVAGEPPPDGSERSGSAVEIFVDY